MPLLVLYGLGTTIGAGIYVLIGEAALIAGIYAPMGFVVASIVMGFSACTFAELVGRFPQSAGEASYVRYGLRSDWLALLTGGMMVLAAIVAAAAITLGCTGYLLTLFDLPEHLVITAIIVLMTAVAAWGIMESVTLAAIMTVVEIGGLFFIIIAGLWLNPALVGEVPKVIPPISDGVALVSIFNASLIAFFAFIGFDSMVNLAEETKDPARTMPWGIFLTLGLATLIYFLVSAIAVLSVPIDELAASRAPIGLLFERITGTSSVFIVVIAIVATTNGIIIEMILAARVLYGLSSHGSIPRVFGRISPVTRTPVVATVVVGAITLLLALYFPIGGLAQATTQVILVIFSLVNLSLIRVKLRKEPAPENAFVVGLWLPVCGLLTCLGLLLVPYLIRSVQI